jgi:hypothetical protein
MVETNPNGANGTTSDPREQACWDYYVESITNGSANAYQSAIKAGYEEATAKQITVRRWFVERLEDLDRKQMLSDAEKVLRKTLRYKTDEIDKNGNEKIKSDVLRIQVDASKHITSTLGKDKGYSSRTELGGIDGKDLFPDKESQERADKAIDQFLK